MVARATRIGTPEQTKKLVDEFWEYYEKLPATAITKQRVADNARQWSKHKILECEDVCVYCNSKYKGQEFSKW